MPSQPVRRRIYKEPLICDIFLNHDLTLSDNAQLTIEFIKFICLQKGQIPVSCSQLQKLSSLAQTELENPPKPDMTPKERATALKSRRKYIKFIKKADSFQKNLEELSQSIISSFEVQTKQIAIILGSSVFNPKETFVLDWSCCPEMQILSSSCDTKKEFLKKQANFFRYLVTAEELFPILQTTRPTKLHVLCQTDSVSPAGCIPRVNYKITPFSRGRQVTIRVLRQSQIPLSPSLLPKKDAERFEINCKKIVSKSNMSPVHVTRTVSRRLIFSSPATPIEQNSRENCILDLSGFDRLEDENSSGRNIEWTSSESVIKRYWFQIHSSLTGFLDTFN